MEAKTGNNPTIDRSKRGTKHIKMDNKRIPFSAVILFDNIYDTNLVTYITDNTVITRKGKEEINNFHV